MKKDFIHFLDAMSCDYKIYYNSYNNKGDVLEHYPDIQKYTDIFLRNTRIIEMIGEDSVPTNKPLVYSGLLSLIWIAVKDAHNIFHLLGPFLEQSISAETIANTIADAPELIGAVEERKKIIDKFLSYPVVTRAVRDQYALMFAYYISGKQYKLNDIEHYSYLISENNDNLFGGKFEAYSPQSAEQISFNETFRFIREIYRSIVDGNLSYALEMGRRASSVTVNFDMFSDPLRIKKDEVLLFLSICSYASMVGGVIPDTAYSLVNDYVKETEACTNLADLQELSIKLYKKFVELSHSFHYTDKDISLPIYQAQEYIKLHIADDIDLQKVADHFNYTEYYFSKKFKKECHTSVNNYIKEQKIEQAKQLLLDPTLSISDVSDMLSFSSISFFSVTFKKFTGVSPSEFRDSH